jgi:hypothetical protein
MEIVKILTGHTNRQTAIVVTDTTHDRRKATKYLWIETKPGVGDRLVTVVCNPNTGQESKPAFNKFCTFAYLFLDEAETVDYEVMPFAESSRSNQDQFFDLMTRIDPMKLSCEQQYHIRKKIYEIFLWDSTYEHKKLTGKNLQQDQEWTMKTLLHIENSPFAKIASYPTFLAPKGWPITVPLRYEEPPSSDDL